MIDGWDEPFVNVHRLYAPEYDDASDAWIKQAATSRGVEPTENPPLAESVMPRALRSISSRSRSLFTRCSCVRSIRKTTWRSMGLSRVATRCAERCQTGGGAALSLRPAYNSGLR